MSLLTDSMEKCNLIDRTTVSDGLGGYSSTWKEGAEFLAAIRKDSSIEARVAEKQGVTALYTITTKKAMNLQYHDIVQRASDKKIFRVTSDGDDVATPDMAGLNMRQVSAEEFVLPDA